MKHLLSVILACIIAVVLTDMSHANFSVSPLTIEKTVKPGTTQNDSFALKNLTEDSITVTIDWADKTIDPVADWFSISVKEIILNAGQSVDVPYQINLPADARGLYYARMRFSENPPPDAVVGIRKRYNFPIRIVAEGTEQYDFTVKHVDVYQEKGTVFKVTILNKSNTFIYPAGDITVASIDRENEVFKIDFNSDKDIIYPQEEYLCEGNFIGNMLLPDGSYRAELNITAGSEKWNGTIMFKIDGDSVTILE